jgi:hypothetical protein
LISPVPHVDQHASHKPEKNADRNEDEKKRCQANQKQAKEVANGNAGSGTR